MTFMTIYQILDISILLNKEFQKYFFLFRKEKNKNHNSIDQEKNIFHKLADSLDLN